MRKIILTFIVACSVLLVKADDSGEVNFALQGYVKDLNEAKTVELKSFLLDRIISEAGRSDTDLANSFLKKFEKLIAENDLPIARVRYYKSIGVINYYKKMELDSIFFWYDKAAKEIEIQQVSDVKLQLALYNNRAIAFAQKNQVDKAFDEYLQALETLSNSKERLYRSETLLLANSANHLQNNSRLQEALEYITKALEANDRYESDLRKQRENNIDVKTIKEKRQEIRSSFYEYLLYMHANILHKLGKSKEAEKPLQEILDYNNTTSEINNYARSLLGIIYTQSNKTEMARSIINEALQEAKGLGSKTGAKSYAYLALAQLELEEGNPKASLRSLEKIMQYHEEAEEDVNSAEILETMAKALEGNGRYKESIAYLKKHQAVVEEQKAKEAKMKIGAFKSQLNNIEKKYQISELEIKQKLQESKMSVLVVAFLLSIISIFFVFMMYKEKEEHNKKLLEINKEVLAANENVMAASKTKENFLSTMSHEMRTPMNAVIGITDILLDENPTGKQKEHLTNLKFSGEVLLNIINEVLDFSKIATNKIEIIREPLNLQEFLDRTISAYRHSHKNSDVRIYQDQELNELNHLISMDKSRFSQVLTNLIGNAIKFTNHGHIVFRSKIIENYKEMIKIKFEIEDSGVGIPKDKLESIFESFSQVNNEINRTHEGAGLGLTITKKLIELKGGKIEVISKEGEGTTFSFSLEFNKAEPIKKVEEAHAPTNKIFQTGIEGKKILLVEDNKLNQLVAQKVLKKFKVITSLAENGQEALDMVQQESFDLILMDIHMPIMDGLEATRRIRALEDPYQQQIPIIALSADAYSDKVQATTESGMNDYQSKPFKPEDLFQKIKLNLERANVSKHRGTT